MSAGVSDQRMKAQGNSVSRDEQIESSGDVHPNEGSWRQQQQPTSYLSPMSAAAEHPYITGYYSTAGTAAIPYQACGVGDGTWSTNGTDPITFLGGYNPHDSYGIDGVYNPSTTSFSAPGFAQPASSFNYFHGNSDFSSWGQFGRSKHEDIYGQEVGYSQDGVKSLETGMQALGVGDHKHEKERFPDISLAQPKRTTWASIASQPAKPNPPSHSLGLKKKGPGMPPPPVVPGKHNMDIGAWDIGKSVPPPVIQATMPPPPVPLASPINSAVQMSQHNVAVPMASQMTTSVPPPSWPPRPHVSPAPIIVAPRPLVVPPAQPQSPVDLNDPNPVLEELHHKNQYNPSTFDLDAPGVRFFVIKSYSEDDIHRSIKYEIWCSTEHGNKRLDAAFRERQRENGMVYLLFSVNGSGHFCGMAQMVSPVDYNSNSSVWSQDKWKGQFGVRWIYVKDVPNVQLRHIRLENNENKPVTNSRDTQEVPHAKGLQVLRIMHGYCHSTSIFDDFIHYEKRQEEEDSKKTTEPSRENMDNGPHGFREGKERRDPRNDRNPRDHRDGRDNRNPRDGREFKDNRDMRDGRDTREGRDMRDSRELRGDYRNTRADSRDMRDSRDFRDTRDVREHRDMRGDNRDLRKDHRDMRGDSRNMHGDSRNMHGDSRDMRGENRDMQGDGRDMRGDSRDMRGDGRGMRGDHREYHRDQGGYNRDNNFRSNNSKDRQFDSNRGRGGGYGNY